MVERQFDELLVGKHAAHRRAEVLPVIRASEVVEDDEASLLEVLAHRNDVLVGELHEPRLRRINHGILEQLGIADVDDARAIDVRFHVRDGVEDLDQVRFGARPFTDRDVAVSPRGQPAVVIAAGTGGELQARERELSVVRRRLVDRRVDRRAEPSALREHPCC